MLSISVDAELPNITGYWGQIGSWRVTFVQGVTALQGKSECASGLCYWGNIRGGETTSSNSGGDIFSDDYVFDGQTKSQLQNLGVNASRVSSIYKTNGGVKPNSNTVRFYIKY